jgi:hypothetical protein
MIIEELKPIQRVLQGGGKRALGERSKRERDLFGNTNWINNKYAYARADAITNWNRQYNELKDIMECEYYPSYGLSVEDITFYIHACEGEIELILRNPNLLDGKSHNIFNKTVRYLKELPISRCANYLYNHPELLGSFIYDPNTNTFMSKLSEDEVRYDIYSQLVKRKYGRYVSNHKKLDTALLANSWGEDRVPEDSPYNHNRKKGK